MTFGSRSHVPSVTVNCSLPPVGHKDGGVRPLAGVSRHRLDSNVRL
jgi:hypothetical protein